MCAAIAEGEGTCTPHIWGPLDENLLRMVADLRSSGLPPCTYKKTESVGSACVWGEGGSGVCVVGGEQWRVRD